MIVMLMYLRNERRVDPPTGYPTTLIVPSLDPTNNEVESVLIHEMQVRGLKPDLGLIFAWFIDTDPSEETVH